MFPTPLPPATSFRDAATFRRVRGRRVISQLVDDLRRRIVSGELPFDRQLPSLRRLARLYGVSVPTMHAAVHAVAALGLLTIVPGRGTFVGRPRHGAAVLNHAWVSASIAELAALRAGIDERTPVLLARQIGAAATPHRAQTVRDVAFMAAERSSSRIGVPALTFVQADLRFHATVASALREMEILPTLGERIGVRLMPHLAAAAGILAADDRLDGDHLALADALERGATMAVHRLARRIAEDERASLIAALG